MTKPSGSRLKEDSVLIHSTDVTEWLPCQVPSCELEYSNRQKWAPALGLAPLLKTVVTCAHTNSLVMAALEIGMAFVIGHCASPASLGTHGLYVPLNFIILLHKSILVEKTHWQCWKCKLATAFCKAAWQYLWGVSQMLVSPDPPSPLLGICPKEIV